MRAVYTVAITMGLVKIAKGAVKTIKTRRLAKKKADKELVA